MSEGPTQSDVVEETIQRLAELHHEHRRTTSAFQRVTDRITRALGRPVSVAIILVLILAWIVGNIWRSTSGAAVEVFPFPDLGFVATVAAFLVALLILTTQRHEDELAEKRAQLTLQIAVLNEKKISKIIELLEEQRRDNPMLASRVDPEAEEMAQSSDTRTSLTRIEETHQDPK